VQGAWTGFGRRDKTVQRRIHKGNALGQIGFEVSRHENFPGEILERLPWSRSREFSTLDVGQDLSGLTFQSGPGSEAILSTLLFGGTCE
jgi:hypothetical protein